MNVLFDSIRNLMFFRFLELLRARFFVFHSRKHKAIWCENQGFRCVI